MAKEKVQITMDTDLLNEVDQYCDRNYMNRSWMISQACLAAVNQQKMIDAISSLSVTLRAAVEKGNIDDETRKEIESFEALCRLFVK